MSRRLLLAAALLVGVGGSAACSPTDNCLVRGDCGDQVHIVRVEDNLDDWMSRGEAEVKGLEAWIEVPAADTLAACDDPDNLDRSACPPQDGPQTYDECMDIVSEGPASLRRERGQECEALRG